MDENVKMRQMLISLSFLIDDDDLKTMKFFCKDVIPARLRDAIQSPVDLFEKLEERGKLKSDDLSFLKLLLEGSCHHRTDLLVILDKHLEDKRLLSGASKWDRDDNQGPSSIFSFLMKNLGREYLMVLRRLKIPDTVLEQLKEENPYNVQELIYKALLYWHRTHAESICKEDIVIALKAEYRNDLAQKLMTGDL